MNRTLLIDPQEIPAGTRILENRAGIDRLYERYFALTEASAPKLVLDCRSLPSYLVGRLLKFIEEYRGELILVVRDPVSGPILSRFVVVEKDFRSSGGSWAVRVMSKNVYSPGVRQGIMNLFDGSI